MTAGFGAALAAGSGVLAFLGTFALRRWAPKVGLVDVPNERSSHRTTTPRGGGLSFVMVAPLMTILAIRSFEGVDRGAMAALLVGGLMIAAVSLADDRWGLPILVRFGAHAAGAAIVLAGAGWIHRASWPGGPDISLGPWGIPLTFLWIVGLTNAYNFMDGIDGLAAGQAVIAAATMSGLAFLQGQTFVALAMAILSAAVLGFLPHNWQPARIFMGDVGSAFLGFTFAGGAVWTSGSGPKPLPLFAWLAVMAPFVFDTAITLISRIIRRQRWYEAHREHFYQRLIRQGWSHASVARLYLGISAFLGLATIFYYGYDMISSPLYIGFVVAPLGGLALLVRRIEKRSA